MFLYIKYFSYGGMSFALSGIVKNVMKNRNTRFEVDEVTAFQFAHIIKIIKFEIRNQVIRFRSDHEGELDTAVREARQAVEKGEANVRWMGEHYQVCLFRLFVCIDGFKSRVITCTQIARMQMSCAEFVSPDALLDLGFCSPRLDASSRLGAPVSWEMSLGDEHRNGILPLQLGHFYCLFSSSWVFPHQQSVL